MSYKQVIKKALIEREFANHRKLSFRLWQGVFVVRSSGKVIATVLGNDIAYPETNTNEQAMHQDWVKEIWNESSFATKEANNE